MVGKIQRILSLVRDGGIHRSVVIALSMMLNQIKDDLLRLELVVTKARSHGPKKSKKATNVAAEITEKAVAKLLV